MSLMVKVKSKLPKGHTKNSSFEGTEFARQGLHISEIEKARYSLVRTKKKSAELCRMMSDNVALH